VRLTVKIQPGAKKSEIIGWEGDALKIRIAAQPIDGKANEALIAFLAKTWKLKRSDIMILHGTSGRLKYLEVPDSIQTQLPEKLAI
jgi:uncharacterized protein (TIGR00251 family)